MQKVITRILEDIAKKYNMDVEIIKEIYNSPYQCIRSKTYGVDTKDPTTFIEARLKHLGKIYTSGNRIKTLNKDG